MTAFFFKNIPDHALRGFVPVRDALDNIWNVVALAEILNTCSYCRTDVGDEGFDIAIFAGGFSRALVKKQAGFFSMAIPFQIVETPDGVRFNFNSLAEEVSGLLISIIRNAITTSRHGFCHENIAASIEDNFNVGINLAAIYSDSFIELLCDDHGYLRFDDDPVNENGTVHPRYHFDFFYKNSSSIKIGMDGFVDLECFYSLFDRTLSKRYLRV